MTAASAASVNARTVAFALDRAMLSHLAVAPFVTKSTTNIASATAATERPSAGAPASPTIDADVVQLRSRP